MVLYYLKRRKVGKCRFDSKQDKTLSSRCSGGDNEMQAATFFVPGFNSLVLLDALVTVSSRTEGVGRNP
jgi:hypothetical protein